MRLLFVCSQNRLRSPTAEVVFSAYPGVEAISAGPGSPGTEMDHRLIKIPGATTITKNRSDAFSTPELDAYLREYHVDQLLLTGLDGAYCVDATARGALNRGYQVTLLQDGIATESRNSIENLAKGWREAGAQVKTGTEM